MLSTSKRLHFFLGRSIFADEVVVLLQRGVIEGPHCDNSDGDGGGDDDVDVGGNGVVDDNDSNVGDDDGAARVWGNRALSRGTLSCYNWLSP